MATHEAIAGLGFNADVAELGIVGEAALGFSSDAAGGLIQTLELAAALGFSSNAIAQQGNQNLEVAAITGGEASRSEGKYIDAQPYRVSGLASADPVGRRYEALTAPGIPLEGQAHPTIPGIQVISTTARFELEGAQFDQTRALVDVHYGLPLATDLEKNGGVSGGGVLTLSPATYQESIWFDRNGDPMIVRYSFFGAVLSRTVQAQIQRKTWTATLTKEFATPQYVDMLRPSAINSAAFGPFAAHTLLFLGPTINETDEGQYTHGYQMTFNPSSWILRASVLQNGVIPSDATVTYNPPVEPGGLGEFEIHDQFDFHELPVFFP